MMEEQPTVLNCDNQSCVDIAKNPIFHARMKPIEIQYHFVHEMIMLEEVEIIYCPTTENYADIFTKALYKDKLEWLLLRLGIGPRH